MRTYQKFLAVIALSGLCFLPAAASENEGAVKSKKSARADMASEAKCEACEAVKRLEDKIAAQQAQIAAQQMQIDQLKSAQAPQPTAADEQARAQAAAAKQAADEAAAASAKNDEAVKSLQSQVADLSTTTSTFASTSQGEQKRASALEDLAGRFRFGGDVRVRYENFFQGIPEPPGFNPRHRERIRARLGVEGKLTEDFTGGVYLATGALTDPTSTNETFTNAFERKTVGWDRGWITFQPRNARWLQLTGGKFAYTWIRTPNTFDNDLNPEGFSEKLSFDVKNPVVRNVTFTGMQLFFNESSSGADTFAVGGQFSSKLQLGNRIAMVPSLSVLNWRNENSLLNEPASVTGSTTLSCTNPAPGTVTCTFPSSAFGPNGLTNATNGTSPNRTFASKFLYLDAMLDTTIKTGLDRFPVRLLLEYEENLNAVSNASHLYLGDISVGRLKEKNDLLVGYGLWRQEQDSVIASFVESDQRAPTNLFQHRLFAQWLVRKNTTAAYSFWFGRTLDRNLQNAIVTNGAPVGESEPLLRRMQFDLIYKF